MTESDEQQLRQRLEMLGVETTDEEVRELAEAYPALRAWMRMVEELAEEDET